VLEPAFRQDILDATTGQQITKLFTIMLDAPGLQFGDLRNRVDFMFLSWLRHPASFEAEPAPGPWIQRRVLVERVRVLVVSGRLDVCNDAAALKRFLQWVNAWDPTRKAEVAGIITYLQANYPADDLWDAFKPPPRQEETQ
jgi:hypothetical protein